MLHRGQSLGPKRGLIGGKMESWLLTGFELVRLGYMCLSLSLSLPHNRLKSCCSTTICLYSTIMSYLHWGTIFVKDYGLRGGGGEGLEPASFRTHTS
jgi:hypothetical protein